MTGSTRVRRVAARWLGCLCVALPLAAGPAVGQDRPERPPTGRTRAEPAARSQAPREPGAEWGRWSLQVGAGIFTSGDLFRVTLPGGGARPWVAPAGAAFTAPEFLVTLDEDLQFVLAATRRLGGRWHARLDLGWSEADATAEARVGQTVELFLWDRVTVLAAALAIECRLVDDTVSYPYALAGAALVSVSAAGIAELDQTLLAPRLGLGFQLGFPQGWGLRAEVRDTVRQLGMDDYAATAVFDGAEFDRRGPQHLFELTGSVRVWF